MARGSQPMPPCSSDPASSAARPGRSASLCASSDQGCRPVPFRSSEGAQRNGRVSAGVTCCAALFVGRARRRLKSSRRRCCADESAGLESFCRGSDGHGMVEGRSFAKRRFWRSAAQCGNTLHRAAGSTLSPGSGCIPRTVRRRLLRSARP